MGESGQTIYNRRLRVRGEGWSQEPGSAAVGLRFERSNDGNETVFLKGCFVRTVLEDECSIASAREVRGAKQRVRLETLSTARSQSRTSAMAAAAGQDMPRWPLVSSRPTPFILY
eukprot:scaffold73654_cov79-Phaeocystis_antarctica.AAC.1